MTVTNKKTGQDITKYVIQYLSGEIIKNQFEKKTKLKN